MCSEPQGFAEPNVVTSEGIGDTTQQKNAEMGKNFFVNEPTLQTN